MIVLDDDRLKTLDQIGKCLGDKYRKEDILEAYSEVKQLVKNGTLYSEDIYKNAALRNDSTPSFIKALCLNIAHDCNLRCKYCFADEGEYKGKRKLMSAEIGKKRQ